MEPYIFKSHLSIQFEFSEETYAFVDALTAIKSVYNITLYYVYNIFYNPLNCTYIMVIFLFFYFPLEKAGD